MRYLVAVLLCLTMGVGFGQNLTYIPDDTFEHHLINEGYDDILDDYVLTGAIDTLTSLAISNVGDLTGLEAFINLNTLELFFPSVIYIDISPMLNLIFLRICQSQLLESLNLQNGVNTSLSDCHLYGNPNLTCIQVDDSDWSIDNWPIYDPWNYFETNCDYNTIEELSSINKSLLKNVDILGRETTNNGFQLVIYDDGSVEKKFVVE